jgi:hypothetical protein
MEEMASLKGWWKSLFSDDRRKSDRVPAPALGVYYWTGAEPKQHQVRDISPTGLYVVTDERWYIGTLVTMTLQKIDVPADKEERSIAVQSKAVRHGEDGVGLQFILRESAASHSHQGSMAQGVDRKTLDRFLEGLTSGAVTIKDVAAKPAQPQEQRG